MSVDPEKDMRVETYRVQARHDIGKQDPIDCYCSTAMYGLIDDAKHKSEASKHTRMGKEI